mmetsp:Transcript_6863/g.8443  ORF Transcript_6863/g.8443 Transcript_6863/m.8443 type:complete len:86 (+) Transcript_6863:499-756(+)
MHLIGVFLCARMIMDSNYISVNYRLCVNTDYIRHMTLPCPRASKDRQSFIEVDKHTLNFEGRNVFFFLSYLVKMAEKCINLQNDM